MAFDAGNLVATLRTEGLPDFLRDVRAARQALTDLQTGSTAGAQASERAQRDSSRAVRERGNATRDVARAEREASRLAAAEARAQTQAQRDAARAAQASARAEAQAARQAAQAERDATRAVEKRSDAQRNVGVALTAFGGAAAAAIGLAAHASAEFEGRMAQVQSLTKASNAQMDQARTAAFGMGAAYGQSANDVADAQIELTKAGQGLEQQLKGGLQGALTLAAAGQLDVADATSIATSTLTQFHLGADQTTHVADLLAAGADKALGSVADLGMGLKQAGLVSAQFGMSADETVGTLSLFANNGLMASDAGTSLRTMLLSLATPSKQSADLMKHLGINAYDAQGNFVGMERFAGILQQRLGGLDAQQRQTALGTIFGSDAIRAASILTDAGAASTAKWTNGMDSAGFAATQAAGKLNSLQGDSQKLQAAWETGLIRAGDALTPMFRNVMGDAGGLLNLFGKIPGPVLTVAGALTAVAAASAVSGGAALLVGPKWRTMRTEMAAAGVTARGVAGVMGKGGLLVAALLAAGSAIGGLFASNEATANAKQLAEAGRLIKRDWAGVDAQFQGGLNITNSMVDLRSTLDALEGGTQFQEWSAKLIDATTGWTGVGTKFDDQFKSNRQTLAAFGEQLTGLPLAQSAQKFQELNARVGGTDDSAKRLLTTMPAYQDALRKAAQNAGVHATQQDLANIALGKGADVGTVFAQAAADAAGSSAEVATQLQQVSGSAQVADTDVKALTDSLNGLGNTQLDANAAERDFQQAVDDAAAAVGKNGQHVRNHRKELDLSTAAGRANSDALDAIGRTAVHVAGSLEANKASQKDVTEAVREGRAQVVKAARDMGLSEQAANDYADSLHLIPHQVSTLFHITATGTNAVRQGLEDITSFNGRTVHVNIVTNEAYVQGPGRLGTAARAEGGDLDMAPGPKGKDSMLFVGARGEHVLTASDVDKMGGQQRVYAFREAVQQGRFAGAFALGGQIGSAHSIAGSADTEADELVRRIRRLKAHRQELARAESRAQHAYDDEPGDKAHRAAKRSLKDRHDAAQRALDHQDALIQAAQKRHDDARQREQQQQQREVSLRQTGEDVGTSNLRGEYTQGAQSTFGAVDELRSLSRSSDIGAATRRRLDADANTQGRALVALQKRYTDATAAVTTHEGALKADQDAAQNAAQSLDTAKGALQSVKDAVASMASGVASTVRGLFRLGDSITAASEDTRTVTHGSGRSAWSETATVQRPATVTLSTIRGNASTAAAAMEQFANDLQALVRAGYSTAVVQDVAALGVDDGHRVAQAMLSATKADVASVNQSYARQAAAGARAGQTVAQQALGGEQANAQRQLDAATRAAAAADAQVVLEQKALDAANAHVAQVNDTIVLAQKAIVNEIRTTLAGAAVGSGDTFDFRGAQLGYDPARLIAEAQKAKQAANLKRGVTGAVKR